MLNLKHKDLRVWKLSIEIIKELYSITADFPKQEMFGVTSQVRRAALSIPLNIAEGLFKKIFARTKKIL